MRATIEIEEPNGIEVTVSITMPIVRWQELRGQLAETYPSWVLSGVIGAAISKIETAYIVPTEKENL